MEILLNKEYCTEDLADIERDVYESITLSPNKIDSSIKVTVVMKQDEEDWGLYTDG